MALKPTIYKLNISLSDLNRDYYDALNLTVALHPSETMERMMVRVMAFCLNASERLAFSKGLSATDEPDIWSHTLDDQISNWIDVGEPATARVKKATQLSHSVKVYSFNTKSDVWWAQGQEKFKRMPAEFYRFNWQEIQKLTTFVERTMKFSVTVSDETAFIATGLGECEVSWMTLKSAD